MYSFLAFSVVNDVDLHQRDRFGFKIDLESRISCCGHKREGRMAVGKGSAELSHKKEGR